MNICPHCEHSNRQGVVICENCGQKMYTQPQTEWRSAIDQLAQDYRSGHAKGLVHGLQKDAVQNGWGARSGRGNWGFDFCLFVGPDKTRYLTMTDWGTTGLTGHIYEDPESIPDNLPPEERLARFENMNFSGGNEGPGLYGRGKLLFQAASQRGSIIYDSLTADGAYRLGIRFQEGRRLQQFPKVVEGQAAKNMLDKHTGGTLEPLRKVGTRITIVEPLEEIIDSIKDGSFLKYIEETWWEILYKYANQVEISLTTDSVATHARCPDLLEELTSGKLSPTSMYRIEHKEVPVKGTSYRVKRMFMGKANHPVPEELRGIYAQRKGMKVGTVELREVPADLEEYLFGFIELDKEYEEEIAKSEDLTHYSFSALYASYRELKKFAQRHFDEFKKQLGYDVGPDKTADQRARDALRVAHEKLNQIMQDLGLKGLGINRPKKEISVSVANVEFPTAGSKRVEMDEVVSNVKFKVANRSKYDRDLKVIIDIRTLNGAPIEEIKSAPLSLKSNTEQELPPFDIRIKRGLYPNYEQIFCSCRAEAVTGELLAHTRFPVYVGIDHVEEIDPIQIRLDNIEMPRQNSARVNYGEEVKNIRFGVKNNSATPLDLRVSVVTLDPQYENQEIESIKREDVRLNAMSELDVFLPSLKMDEAIYGIVHEGRVKLRCRVTSLKNQDGMEKGQKWVRDVTFWLNKDEPGFGIFESEDSFDGGADQPRARVKEGSMDGRWIFLLNLTHPHYEAVQADGQNLQGYIFELMAREALYIALHGENYEPFNNAVKQGDQPYEVSKEYNAAVDKVLAAYYEK